jgi:hydrogenase maturation protein HypF
MAVGTLATLDASLLEHPGAAPLRSRLAAGEERILLEMIDRGVNCPPTSSMGRLFDTVAALSGVRDDARYEGQAAIELEALADTSAAGAYRFGLLGSDPAMLDPAPVLSSILDDVAEGVPASIVSARFHRAVADIVVRVARRAADDTGTDTVTLSGGVFMNRLLLDLAVPSLVEEGLRPLTHIALPSNDGGISFGQAVVAWSRRSEV